MTALRRWPAPEVVLLATALLVAAAFLAVAAGAPAKPLPAGPAVPGLGRATDLSRCVSAFDPRTGADCSLRHGPVPGADPLCPDHALPPLRGGR